MDPRLVPYETIRKELKKRDKQRDQDPDRREVEFMKKQYVVYIWKVRLKTWVYVGTHRITRLTSKAIRRLRRKYKAKSLDSIRVVDMLSAQKSGGSFIAPARIPTTAPAATRVQPAAVVKTKARRVRAVAEPAFAAPRARWTSCEARWLAIGTLKDQRLEQRPLYLGPIDIESERGAMKEAKRIHNLYDITLIHVDSLPKGWRRRLKNGRIQPGVTRFKTLPTEVTNG